MSVQDSDEVEAMCDVRSISVLVFPSQPPRVILFMTKYMNIVIRMTDDIIYIIYNM